MREPTFAPRWGYREYMLGVLATLLLCNYIDRMALGILLQDIKTDLQLSDTQIGLLSGIAFALFYSVMGIPLARWADRGNRIVIITVTALVWSVGVALCGAATTFLQLLLIRIAVAVGEAGCIPPATSLIADYFNRAERPRANAIYAIGGAFSLLISFSLAGWLNEFYGWRTTFVILAAPGLLVGALAYFTLREPRRSSVVRVTQAGDANCSPSLRIVFATLWANKTFKYLLACQSAIFFFGYGIFQWQPAFFMRSYGLSSGEIGMWMSAVYGIGGMLGSLVAGEWATRYAPNNERLQMTGVAATILLSTIFSSLTYVVSNPYLGFTLTGTSVFFSYAGGAPISATLQSIVPARMRAVTVALWYLIANLVGMGFGPLVSGVLSDAFRGWAGDESLRYALLALAPISFMAAWMAWQMRNTVAQDIAAASAASAPASLQFSDSEVMRLDVETRASGARASASPTSQ